MLRRQDDHSYHVRHSESNVDYHPSVTLSARQYFVLDVLLFHQDQNAVPES